MGLTVKRQKTQGNKRQKYQNFTINRQMSKPVLAVKFLR